MSASVQQRESDDLKDGSADFYLINLLVYAANQVPTRYFVTGSARFTEEQSPPVTALGHVQELSNTFYKVCFTLKSRLAA